MMRVKIHDASDGKKIVAICDSELHGQIFEDDNVSLDLSSDFFNGEKMEISVISKIIKEAYVLNACGKETIEFLKNEISLDDSEIKIVKGVPYTNVFCIDTN